MITPTLPLFKGTLTAVVVVVVVVAAAAASRSGAAEARNRRLRSHSSVARDSDLGGSSGGGLGERVEVAGPRLRRVRVCVLRL